MSHEIKATLTVEASKATPAIAGIIARVLMEHGATITGSSLHNGDIPLKLPKLGGLVVDVKIVKKKPTQSPRWLKKMISNLEIIKKRGAQ